MRINYVVCTTKIICREPPSFALLVIEPEEPKERVLHFTLPEDYEMEKYQKLSVVKFFAKQAANAVNKVDYVSHINRTNKLALLAVYLVAI